MLSSIFLGPAAVKGLAQVVKVSNQLTLKQGDWQDLISHLNPRCGARGSEQCVCKPWDAKDCRQPTRSCKSREDRFSPLAILRNPGQRFDPRLLASRWWENTWCYPETPSLCYIVRAVQGKPYITYRSVCFCQSCSWAQQPKHLDSFPTSLPSSVFPEFLRVYVWEALTKPCLLRDLTFLNCKLL